jgi:signal peptidase I
MGSMEPTIKAGSRVLVDTSYYTRNPVKRFDIVVVKNLDGGPGWLVRRVIGLGGETIWIQSGKVFVNGKEIKEDFSFIPSINDFGPITIPQEQFFLLGDNRPDSIDSTSWKQPTVDKDAITGKVTKIVGKWSLIKPMEKDYQIKSETPRGKPRGIF